MLDLLTIPLLIVALGSDSFREREAAHRELAAYGDLALPALRCVTTTTRDPERRRRCEALIALRRPATVARLCGDAPPWIDALPFDHPQRYEIIQAFLPLARPADGETCVVEPAPYPEFRRATRLWVHDLLSGGMDEADVALLLKAMRDRCPLWDMDPKWRGWADDPARPSPEDE